MIETAPPRAGGAAWDAASFRLLHVVSTAFAVAMALALSFWSPDWRDAPWLLAFAPACAAALFLALGARVTLADFLGQLGFRERFLVFLLHAGVYVSPRVFGISDPRVGLSLVLALVCLQCHDRITFGRAYALSGAMAVWPCINPPGPPAAVVALWMLGLLSAIRFEYVAFRLEDYAPDSAMRRSTALREHVRAVLVPWAGGVVAWLGFARTYEGRALSWSFEGVALEDEARQAVELNMNAFLLDAAIIVAMIIAAILVLAWLDRKLRFRGRGRALDPDGFLGATESSEARGGEPPGGVEFEDGEGARGQVLGAFRRFARRMEVLGDGRASSETPGEYLRRVAGEGSPADTDAAAGVFDRACYSNGPVLDIEADRFMLHLASQEREALAAKRPRGKG